MKILQISPQVPFPPNDGGKIGIYNITKHLSQRGHEITLVCVTGILPLEYINEINQICDLVQMELASKISFINKFSFLLTKTPLNIAKYQNDSVKNNILQIASENSFDIVHLDHLHMSFYGEAIKNQLSIPVVLREHNIESKILQRLYQSQSNPLYKLILYWEWQKLQAYESRYTAFFDLCMMITDSDETLIKKINPQAKTQVITAGVDDSFVPLDIPEEPLTILYNAPLDWLPNYESIKWFIDKVFPLILKANKSVTLWIIGRNPPSSLLESQNNNIVVFGYVDNIQQYMAKASVIICPILVGSGIRIKILNSFAMGKAVVSTSIGCEGILVENNFHIKIADTPADFADSVLSLIYDSEERSRIGKNALDLIESKYRWADIAEKIELAYDSVVKK